MATDEHWLALRRVMGEPDWAAEPAFLTAAGRMAEQDRIDANLQEWCRSLSADTLVERLWDAGVPVGKVMQPHGQAELAQLESRHFFEEVSHPVIGSSRYSTLPMRFSHGPRTAARTARTVARGAQRRIARRTRTHEDRDRRARSRRDHRWHAHLGHLAPGLAPPHPRARVSWPRPSTWSRPHARVWLERWEPEAASGMSVFTAILRSYQLLNDQVNGVMKRHGFTFVQYQVLAWLETDPESSLTLSWISKTLRIPPATVTDIIDRLEDDRLVRRVPHPSDARTTLAVITAKGRRAANEATQELNATGVRGNRADRGATR